MSALIKPKSDLDILQAKVAQAQKADVIGRPMGNRILVAKFIRETVGRGFLVASVETQREDRWQGKVGMVIDVGPLAFKDDAVNDFCGQTVKPGDFVLFNYSDGSDFDITIDAGDKIHCKMIKDVEIHGIVNRPEMVF